MDKPVTPGVNPFAELGANRIEALAGHGVIVDSYRRINRDEYGQLLPPTNVHHLLSETIDVEMRLPEDEDGHIIAVGCNAQAQPLEKRWFMNPFTLETYIDDLTEAGADESTLRPLTIVLRAMRELRSVNGL